MIEYFREIVKNPTTNIVRLLINFTKATIKIKYKYKLSSEEIIELLVIMKKDIERGLNKKNMNKEKTNAFSYDDLEIKLKKLGCKDPNDPNELLQKMKQKWMADFSLNKNEDTPTVNPLDELVEANNSSRRERVNERSSTNVARITPDLIITGIDEGNPKIVREGDE